MKQVAPLRYEVIFKKAFSVPAIFTAFVHDFLDIELEIDLVETDKVYDPPIGSVATKFDLYSFSDKYLGRSPNFSLDVQDKSGRLRSTENLLNPISFSGILYDGGDRRQSGRTSGRNPLRPPGNSTDFQTD